MSSVDPNYRKIVKAAQEWRARISDGGMSDADRENFKAWLAEDLQHEEVYHQAETYWAAFDYFRTEDVEQRFLRRSWAEKVTATIDRLSALFSSTQAKLALVTAVAAVFVIPVFLSQQTVEPFAADTIMPERIVHSTAIGEIRTVTLDDGTIVTLGADTKIETDFHSDQRIVRLTSGAALFDVFPDPARPFRVESDRITAIALGTVFEVRSNGGVSRVGVAEGKVRVEHPYMIGDTTSHLTTHKVLVAGEQIAATETQGLRRTEAIKPERVGAWRDELLLYDGAPLAEIIADVNRYSAQKITFDSLPDDVLTSEINASFRTSDIDGILKMLPELYPVTIDMSEADIIRIRRRVDQE